jgi:hypothetical protein
MRLSSSQFYINQRLLTLVRRTGAAWSSTCGGYPLTGSFIVVTRQRRWRALVKLPFTAPLRVSPSRWLALHWHVTQNVPASEGNDSGHRIPKGTMTREESV